MVGIICASEVEYTAVVKAFCMEKINEFSFGVCINNDLVIVKSGVSISSSEECTKTLIAQYNIGSVLSVGVAGGLSHELKIGDIITSGHVIHYPSENAYVSTQTHELCNNIFNMVKKYCLHTATNGKYTHTVHKGIQICCDDFVNNSAQASVLNQTYQGLSVDMESAGVFKVCIEAGIPACCLKAISDHSDERSVFYIQRHEDALSAFLGFLLINMYKENIYL